MSWWRRQRVALISLAVALVATAGIHVYFDVLPELEDQRETVTTIAEGDRAEFAGQHVSLDSARWDEFDGPAGTRTISVRLDASGGPESTTCSGFTLTESDTSRVWLTARSELDIPDDSGESSCRESSASYEIVAVFLVPEDADGPFLFDIPGDDDEVIRFAIEP